MLCVIGNGKFKDQCLIWSEKFRKELHREGNSRVFEKGIWIWPKCKTLEIRNSKIESPLSGLGGIKMHGVFLEL